DDAAVMEKLDQLGDNGASPWGDEAQANPDEAQDESAPNEQVEELDPIKALEEAAKKAQQ
ncbi:MAG: hypothetical protein ACK4MK_09505, partial [Tepidimonas ignava]